MKTEMPERVRAAVAAVLRQKGYVSVADVLVEMDRLTPAQLEDWRFGRIPYLERVVQGSLGKLSRIGREIRSAARALGLRPSVTVYRRWGKGPKPALRFSKSGAPSVELAYATHWLPGRGVAESPRGVGGAETPVPAEGPSSETDGAEQVASHGRPPNILQPDVPIVRDPERVGHLGAQKHDENSRLRAFLKWGGLSPQTADRLFHRLGAEVSAEIDCTECASCCRQMSPVLRPKDIARLARRLHVPYPQFRAAHLREEDDGFVFARTPCPLLDGNRCSCYRDRPKDCRSYPHLQKKHMTTRLLGVLENASVCPIVFSVLERLKAELLERGHDWRAGSGSAPATGTEEGPWK